MPRMDDAAVIIVGAGMAGLTCAARLHQAGRACIVLDAADNVGGRVRTDRVDGFLIDRGFQVLLTAYPQVKAWIDLPALASGAFTPGATIAWRGRQTSLIDPRRKPSALVGTVLSGLPTLADKLRLLRLAARLMRGRLTTSTATCDQHLASLGFSARLIDGFFRPFLGGVFLDRQLAAPASFFEFTLRMFALGDAALPAQGIGAVPRQLARSLDVRLNLPVRSVHRGEVTQEDGDVLRARHIVLAVPPHDASPLLGGQSSPMIWRGTTAVMFQSTRSPGVGKALLLDADATGPVNHIAELSAVQPAYAPAGKHLLSANLLSCPDEDDEAVFAICKRQLAHRELLGERAELLQPLRVVRVPHALPATFNTPALPTPAGVYLCGDGWTQPSMNAAMQSGNDVAERVLATID